MWTLSYIIQALGVKHVCWRLSLGSCDETSMNWLSADYWHCPLSIPPPWKKCFFFLISLTKVSLIIPDLPLKCLLRSAHQFCFSAVPSFPVIAGVCWGSPLTPDNGEQQHSDSLSLGVNHKTHSRDETSLQPPAKWSRKQLECSVTEASHC